MKKIKAFSSLFIAFILLTGTAFTLQEGQQEVPKAELPVLITSCGQSFGPAMLKVILQKLKLDFELNPLATAQDLKEKAKSGTPFKSIIIVMGASLKGMGAAGISIDDELYRTSQLIKEARSQGITIIGAHIEGMKRRAQGAAVGDNTDELSIDAVAPNSDFLVITKAGNEDSRFTIIANEKNIPMIEVEKTYDLLGEFEKIFKKNE